MKIKFPKDQDMIYKDCKIRMSNRAMSDLLYAVFKTRSQIRNSYTLDYNNDRKQDSYNCIDVKIFIHPENIPEFEELAGVKLENPIQIQIN